jgi:hypothetical protein
MERVPGGTTVPRGREARRPVHNPAPPPDPDAANDTGRDAGADPPAAAARQGARAARSPRWRPLRPGGRQPRHRGEGRPPLPW